MTDLEMTLEMTRLCAEAMGLEWVADWLVCPKGDDHDYSDTYGYDPLHDDAQAMAILKKFHLTVDDSNSGDWFVVGIGGAQGEHADLNRAIVECVAKMQAAKS
jgi:hypothetical protein